MKTVDTLGIIYILNVYIISWKFKCLVWSHNPMGFLFIFSFFFYIGVQPIDNMIVSGEQWRESAVHIPVFSLPQTPIQAAP